MSGDRPLSFARPPRSPRLSSLCFRSLLLSLRLRLLPFFPAPLFLAFVFPSSFLLFLTPSVPVFSRLHISPFCSSVFISSCFFLFVRISAFPLSPCFLRRTSPCFSSVCSAGSHRQKAPALSDMAEKAGVFRFSCQTGTRKTVYSVTVSKRSMSASIFSEEATVHIVICSAEAARTSA